MRDIVVLDLETLRSAEDCAHCGAPEATHGGIQRLCGNSTEDIGTHTAVPAHPLSVYTPLGWNNKALLGLSIGCYWDSSDTRMHFFDAHTLLDTVQHFVERRPLLVSFNGIQFDFALMRAVLRQQQPVDEGMLQAFKTLAADSYDILVAIWAIDPRNRFARGINSLDAVAQANGFGGKTGHGAQAPRDWTAGRYAHVIEYCQNDVRLTKALFERICARIPIKRAGVPDILLPHPDTEEYSIDK